MDYLSSKTSPSNVPGKNGAQGGEGGDGAPVERALKAAAKAHDPTHGVYGPGDPSKKAALKARACSRGARVCTKYAH